MRKAIKPLLNYLLLLCLVGLNGTYADIVPNTKSEDTFEKTTQKEEIETFDQFYEHLTDAVNNNDWNQVISLTKFPFVFKGQLDMEGKIEVSKQEFKTLFPAFLEKEAYINLDGELIPSTFKGLLMTRMKSAESITEKSAQIHDFEFEKIGGSWKLVRIYTDLNLTNNKLQN